MEINLIIYFWNSKGFFFFFFFPSFPFSLLPLFFRAIGFWKQKKTQIFPLFVGDIKDGAYQRFNQVLPSSPFPSNKIKFIVYCSQ